MSVVQFPQAKKRSTVRVTIDLPVEIEHGETGLSYLTSPLITGLLIAGVSEDDVLRRVQGSIVNLTTAIGAALTSP